MQKLIFLILLSLSISTHSGSRLITTSGVIQVEGAAGGGVVPWAVIPGYTGSDEWGGSIGATHINVDDIELNIFSAAIGIQNRLELSFTRQDFEVDSLGLDIEQDIVGTKVRLFGDVIYGKLPQTSFGVQYKHLRGDDLAKALGADDDHGVDYYLAATKVYLDAFLGRNLLLNATVRATEANQNGILGFSSQREQRYQLVGEFSAALLLTHKIAIGAEYRHKPDQLGPIDEDAWTDIFVAWFPNKHFSLIAAYADLGDVAGLKDQDGVFLSAQLTL